MPRRKRQRGVDEFPENTNSEDGASASQKSPKRLRLTGRNRIQDNSESRSDAEVEEIRGNDIEEDGAALRRVNERASEQARLEEVGMFRDLFKDDPARLAALDPMSFKALGTFEKVVASAVEKHLAENKGQFKPMSVYIRQMPNPDIRRRIPPALRRKRLEDMHKAILEERRLALAARSANEPDAESVAGSIVTADADGPVELVPSAAARNNHGDRGEHQSSGTGWRIVDGSDRYNRRVWASSGRRPRSYGTGHGYRQRDTPWRSRGLGPQRLEIVDARVASPGLQKVRVCFEIVVLAVCCVLLVEARIRHGV